MTRTNIEKVSDYFLSMSCPEMRGIMSNMKIQKLLYYAQGFYLAKHNEPLFDEEIEPWTHGPVVPKKYHDFKKYANKAIPVDNSIDITTYDSDLKDFLDLIILNFGNYTAIELKDMTHKEPPYLDAWNNNRVPITHKSLKDFFSKIHIETDEEFENRLAEIALEREESDDVGYVEFDC